MSDHSHAVILSGGGAYGAYEVGVMKALFSGESPATGYRPLDPGVFTGTSAGAINAAFMTMHSDLESAITVRNLEKIWVDDLSEGPKSCGNGVYRLRADPLRFLEPQCLALDPMDPFTTTFKDVAFMMQYAFTRSANFLYSSAGFPERAFQLFDFSAFISIEPLRLSIRKLFDFDGIRRSERKLRVAATNWSSGDVKIFKNHDMSDKLGPEILQASAATPGVFPPVEIEGDTYVDGGVVTNTPLTFAIKTGASILHVIYLDPDVSTIPLRRLQNTLDTLGKTFIIMFATVANEDIDHALEINQGLKLIEQISNGETVPDSELMGLVRFAGWLEQLKKSIPLRKLTVHRYRPVGELGGALGILNFNQTAILSSIERGYRDAINHDCKVNKCVLPD